MQNNRHQEAIKSLKGDERFYSSIGRFLSEFSNLEFQFKCFIANEINLANEHFDPILSHDFALLCTIAQNVLSRGLDKDHADQLKSLIGKCRKLNDSRVRVVHGWWLIGRRSGKLHHVSRQRLESSTHYKDAVEVAALADEAETLNFELWQILRGTPLPESK
jgi:hypothetical protein